MPAEPRVTKYYSKKKEDLRMGISVECFDRTIPFSPAAFFGEDPIIWNTYKAYAHYFWDFIIFTGKKEAEGNSF